MLRALAIADVVKQSDDRSVAIPWTFDLEPTRGGSRLVHTVYIPPPKLGADELASFFERTDRLSIVRSGMERTLENVKIAAEAIS